MTVNWVIHQHCLMSTSVLYTIEPPSYSYPFIVDSHLLSFLIVWRHFCFSRYSFGESRWKCAVILVPSDFFPYFSLLKLLYLIFSIFQEGPEKLFLSSNNWEDLGFYHLLVFISMDENWIYISFFQVIFFQSYSKVIIKLLYKS